METIPDRRSVDKKNRRSSHLWPLERNMFHSSKLDRVSFQPLSGHLLECVIVRGVRLEGEAERNVKASW